MGTSAKLPPTHQRRNVRKCPVERSACGLPPFAPATQPLRHHARRRTPSEKVWSYAAEPSLGPPPWPSNASWSNKGETSQRPQPERGPKPRRPPRTRWGKGRCTNFHPLKSWLERYMFCTPHHLEEHSVGQCTSCNLFVMPLAQSPQCTDCTGPTVGLPPRDLQKQIWIATSKFIQIHATPYSYIYIYIYNHIRTYTYTYIHHKHQLIDSNGKLQHPNHTGSVDVSSAFPPKKNKVRSRECAHLALTTSFALTALCIWRLTCPAGCAIMGKRGSHRTWLTAQRRQASRGVGGWVQGVGTWKANDQWPLLKMGGESLRIGILQLKQLKAYKKIRRVDLLCSFKLHVHPLGLATDRFHPFAFGFVDPMLELAPYPSGLQGTAHSCSSWVLAGGPMDMARSCCDSHGGRGQDRKHRSPTGVLIDENSCR